MSASETSDRVTAVARLSAFGAGADGDIDLAEAALLLASFDRPEVRLDDYRRRLSDLVQDLAGERDRAGLPESETLAGRATIIVKDAVSRNTAVGSRSPSSSRTALT